MTRQFSRWDILFFVVMTIGVIAAIYHFFGDRPVNGALALAAVTLGTLIRIDTMRHRPRGSHTR